jgi:hypothetical protein
MNRYPWDKTTGKLVSAPAAKASVAVGIFRNRASNPVVQATSQEATEAILWEVGAPLKACKIVYLLRDGLHDRLFHCIGHA